MSLLILHFSCDDVAINCPATVSNYVFAYSINTLLQRPNAFECPFSFNISFAQFIYPKTDHEATAQFGP